MIAKELINHMIPPLKMTDTVEKAMSWMEELRTNALPVVEDGLFKGFLLEETIYDSNQLDLHVAELQLSETDAFVLEHQYFYDILKIGADKNIQMIAVLDAMQLFLGVIPVEDIMVAFAQTAAVQSPGAILVLSMRQIDYSLAELSRLVEAENAKIINSCISNDLLDSERIKLTIKINKLDLTHIAATLERFDYKIIAKYQDASQVVPNEQERLDILMRYLNI